MRAASSSAQASPSGPFPSSPATRLCSAERLADGLRLTLHSDVERDKAGADINRRLVEAGIAVHRFEPVTTSLEQRFLEITS